MVPQPPVFLADHAELQRDVILLSGAEGRHAAAVRRRQPGERADVGDGAGLVAECVVTAQSGRGLELAVRARREVPRPDPLITVVQAIPKGDRGELAVEEMTEVGVDRIMPWAAARCVPVWRAERGAAQSLGQLRPPESGDLVVIVGPEGGITDEENAAFRAAGATPRSLGPTVLRTSTAGTVAAAVLLSRSGRW